MNCLTKILMVSAAALAGSLSSTPALAAVIDFESGFQDLEAVSTVTASDGNQVTFSVGSGLSGGSSPAFIAGVGEPLTAFRPFDGAGTPFEERIGAFVLSDTPSAEANSLNYFIEFAESVSHFSVDVIDYIESLSGGSTSQVTVTAFSDSFVNVIGAATVTNPNVRNAELSSLDTVSLGELGGIRSISIVGNVVDTGTAIDNITFTSIPEPTTLLGSLLVLGMGFCFKSKQHK